MHSTASQKNGTALLLFTGAHPIAYSRQAEWRSSFSSFLIFLVSLSSSSSSFVSRYNFFFFFFKMKRKEPHQ
jgi:hypothetical protein